MVFLPTVVFVGREAAELIKQGLVAVNGNTIF